MEFIDYVQEVEDIRDPIVVWDIGDLHTGSLGFDVAKLHADISRIQKTPNSIVFPIGDLTSGIGFKDKRFDAGALDILPKTRADMRRIVADLYSGEARRAAKLLQELKPYCPYFLSGNHEEAVAKHSQYHPSEEISRITGIPFVGYSAVCRIRVKAKSRKNADYSIIVYTHHGFGGGRTKGAKINRASNELRKLAPINADMVLSGHVHEALTWVEEYIECTERGAMKIVPKSRGFAINGPYQKTWERGATTYGEVAAYPLARLGAVYLICEYTQTAVDTERIDRKGYAWVKRIYDQPENPLGVCKPAYNSAPM